jgi:hypothetical protein
VQFTLFIAALQRAKMAHLNYGAKGSHAEDDMAK